MGMKRMFLAAMALSVVFGVTSVSAQQNGWMSRYWDGCKPSCSWSDKQFANGVGPCKECNKQNQKMNTSDANKSSCEGGNSYTCWDMIPFVDSNDPNKAYGFAATPTDRCGVCFELKFDGGFKHGSAGATHKALIGKTLIVMGSNMGWDVAGGQFDFLVPGGGVGQFDSFSGQLGISKSALGEQSGGLLASLGNPTSLPSAQTQLKGKCSEVFGKSGLEWLKAGCDFYADWLMAANNPTMTYKEVSCPAVLVDRYQKAATGNPPSGGDPPVTPTTYTLTVEKNPTAGGTTTPASSQSSISAGTQVTISATPASGYTFANWTITSGSGTIANANSASTSITVNGNVTVKANFTQNPTTPTKYTLTVSRLPDNGAGTVKVNNADYSAQVSVDGGTAVSIAATPASGYSFTGWTVTTGGASIANASTATTTVTLTSNATITANFTSTAVTPPSGGGGDTIKVEAESYTNKVGDAMKTETANGITNIGYIESGYSTTYNNVSASSAGDYTMQFRVAAGTDIPSYSFTVSVNGQNVGTISGNNTGSWDAYITATLSSKVRLNAGNNTIVLNFQSAVNVDYFLLIGDKQNIVEPPDTATPPNSVKYNTAKANGVRAQVALRPTVRGFTASLAAGHGFTSYSVIDLQGREVRSGKIGAQTTDLSVGNLKHSVVFLRLFGGPGKAPLSLKVVTY